MSQSKWNKLLIGELDLQAISDYITNISNPIILRHMCIDLLLLAKYRPKEHDDE